MADYLAVGRQFPAVRDYLRHRRWARRGDVVAYAPDLEAGAFSTDAAGFRHTDWDGRRWGIADCLDAPRHVLVMGSSHVFGFGLASNAETLPSRLAARLELPCANVSFPEADTRSLHAVLTNVAAQGRRPAAVVLLTGGDVTRHAFGVEADPVFGSPNVEAVAPWDDPEAALAAGAASLGAALRAAALWTQALAALAGAVGAPVILVDDGTFMDKPGPDEVEAACGLGVTGAPEQLRRFEHQRRHAPASRAVRAEVAADLGLPLVGADHAAMTFIDEYHYRADGIERMADAIAPAAQAALR